MVYGISSSFVLVGGFEKSDEFECEHLHLRISKRYPHPFEAFTVLLQLLHFFKFVATCLSTVAALNRCLNFTRDANEADPDWRLSADFPFTFRFVSN